MLEQGGIVANGKLHAKRVGIDRRRRVLQHDAVLPRRRIDLGPDDDADERRHAGVHRGVRPEAGGQAARRGAADGDVRRARRRGDRRGALRRARPSPRCRNATRRATTRRRVMPNVTSHDHALRPHRMLRTRRGLGPERPAGKARHQRQPARRLRAARRRSRDAARTCRPGEPGEAWLRGNVMRGYWNKPDETATALTPDGWLRSEDLIRIDADGYISYVGRLKLMLKVGGENVSIEEVENVVVSHEGIAECGAVGVPDPRRQEVVRVYVVAPPRPCARRGGAAPLARGAPRPLQAAARHPVRRRAAAARQRQDRPRDAQRMGARRCRRQAEENAA